MRIEGAIVTEKTILIVDDSSTIRTLISRTLMAAGHTVLTAGNGMEALATIEWMEKKPDLITLDIDMPVMNGFTVCEQLLEKQKKQGENAHGGIPIVFVSANDSLENRRRGFKLGVTDFVSKPFKSQDIVNAVNKILYQEDQYAGMTALVVDDSSTTRRLIQALLNRIGVLVLSAADGLEALEILNTVSDRIDLIVTDYLMPEMRGDELCKLIRQKPVFNQVPIIVVSAVGDLGVILSFFKSGATDYLCKPFIREELLARVETQLRARQYIKQVEKLNRQLEYLASRDGLTGIYNRRYFQETIEREFALALRHGSELSCLLFDLDFFKKINDNFGHAFGDRVLEEFAAILRIHSRRSDVCARYGGEEFVILLPRTNMEGAVACAEKIRAVAEKHPYQDEGLQHHVTCSVGVASLKSNGPGNADQLVGMADDALYQAKSGGRNQVRMYVAGVV